jgi:hypothetical protein
MREKYCWLMADKPSEQGVNRESAKFKKTKCICTYYPVAGGRRRGFEVLNPTAPGLQRRPSQGGSHLKKILCMYIVLMHAYLNRNIFASFSIINKTK